MADRATGLVDRDGRLRSATGRLAALQRTAGADVGDLLAIPALAGLVRLARSLNILIARTVIVAEGDHDLELIVRAQPSGDAIELIIGGWSVRPQRRPWLMPTMTSEVTAPAPAPPQFSWATDAALRLTEWTADGTAIGQPLLQLVRLVEDGDGMIPLLTAALARTGFVDQPVILRAVPDAEYRLDGSVILAATGAFAGYRGTAARASDAAPDDMLIDQDFTRQLDTALRAPLARIANQADQISAQVDGPLRRDYADYAGDIGTAARHLLALVDDLADLQAIDRPDFTIAGDDIDLADLARRAAGLLQVRAADRAVRIDRPALDETMPARGDFRRVLQILVNLIGNAIRYSPAGSMIWLRIEGDEDTAILIVADQGRGIGADDQLRIFQKFERVAPADTEGSGLGLYISRRLARAMGGDITVDSAPGQGARFILTLPRGLIQPRTAA
jgi:signal transduction histidine kinase